MNKRQTGGAQTFPVFIFPCFENIIIFKAEKYYNIFRYIILRNIIIFLDNNKIEKTYFF